MDDPAEKNAQNDSNREGQRIKWPTGFPSLPWRLNYSKRSKHYQGTVALDFPITPDNRHITPEAVDHALRRLGLESLGVTFVPHDLRRTAATHMTGMGISRLVVGKILNHDEQDRSRCL